MEARRQSGSENHRGFQVWCEKHAIVWDVPPIDSDGSEGEANARLIAAAPELLAVLKDLLEISRNDSDHPKHDSYYDEARAVLAKAEGQ